MFVKKSDRHRGIVTNEELHIARFNLRDEQPLLSKHVRDNLTSSVSRYLQKIQTLIPNTPDNLRTVVAILSEKREEFAANRTISNVYKYTLIKFVQWFMIVCGCVDYPRITDSETGESVPDSRYPQPPERWKITEGPMVNTVKALYEQLDQQEEVCCFDKISSFFQATFERTAKLVFQSTTCYDPVAVFLVASSLQEDGTRYSQSYLTGRVAALEYAMRATILLRARDIAESALSSGSSDEEASIEASEYIKKWTVEHAEKNNVAFILGSFKRKVKRYITNEPEKVSHCTSCH